MSEHKIYICTKVVAAKPMMRGAQDGYEVVYKDGYTSWSPKAAFDDGYIDAAHLGLTLEVFNFRGLKDASTTTV